MKPVALQISLSLLPQAMCAKACFTASRQRCPGISRSSSEPFPVLADLTGWQKSIWRLIEYCYMGHERCPHIAFDLVHGKVSGWGAKSQLYVAVHCRETPENTDILLDYLKQLYEAPVTLLSNYTEITLTPEIQSCTAPSFMVSSVHGGSGTGMLSIIFRVGGVTAELGAYFLARCDEENQALCKAAELSLGIDLSSVQSLQQEIVEAYGDSISDPRTLLSVLRTNKAYEGIPLPLIREGRSDTFIFDKTIGFSGRYWLWFKPAGFDRPEAQGANTIYRRNLLLVLRVYGREDCPSPIPADWPTIRG